jgi:opacity protein-like surface antigen
MKKIVLASICAVGFVGSAIAADLPPAVKAVPMARPACAQFGGWYVGANGATAIFNIISRTATFWPGPSIPDFPGARRIRTVA